jgi:hypothetical protein
VHTAGLFTSFEAQKIDKFMDIPVSTMALHSGHLIKRRDMFSPLSVTLCLYARQSY